MQGTTQHESCPSFFSLRQKQLSKLVRHSIKCNTRIHPLQQDEQVCSHPLTTYLHALDNTKVKGVAGGKHLGSDIIQCIDAIARNLAPSRQDQA